MLAERSRPAIRLASLLAFLVAALASGTPSVALAKKKKKSPSPSVAAPIKPQAEPGEVYGPQWPPPAPRAASDDTVVRTAPPRTRIDWKSGRILVGARAGGAFAQPLSGLGSSFLVGVEVGWVLPALPGVGRGLALALDLAYAQPGASGDLTDPRLTANGGSYHYDVAQRELSLGLTVLYRLNRLLDGRLVPYAGFGPRLFFLQSATSGSAGAGNDFASYHEQSTRIGFGLPVGADYAIGPGRVFLEAMLLYAPFNHNVTGASNAGALTLDAGYRFLL